MLRMLVFSLLAGATGAAALADVPPPADRGTIAISSSRALIVWDATAATDALLGAHLSNDDALRQLERDAVGVAASNVSALPRAQTITVRILYHKTAGAGPYGAQSYDDAVFLAAVTLPAGDVRRQRLRWTPPNRIATLPKNARIELPQASSP